MALLVNRIAADAFDPRDPNELLAFEKTCAAQDADIFRSAFAPGAELRRRAICPPSASSSTTRTARWKSPIQSGTTRRPSTEGEIWPTRSKWKSQWQPGQSGNPAGRAIGSRNKLATVYVDDVHLP